MAYVPAVTNHASTDYFNVADWTRVYGNALEVHNLVESELSVSVTFTTITAPSTTTDPTTLVTIFNTLCTNIENIRDAVVGENITGTTTEIFATWTSGPIGLSPDYTDWNLWESTLDAIYQYFQ